MAGILIDAETHDLVVMNGRVVIGDTSQQTVEAVLLTAPGEWKEHPLLGAHARGQLGGNTDKLWCNQTKKMIRQCGVDVKSIVMSPNGTITIS